jgi:hypothetical protein
MVSVHGRLRGARMLTVGAVKKHPDADGLYVEVSEESDRRM